MSESVIVVEKLSKEYRIGLRAKGDRSLRARAGDVLSYPFQRFRKLGGRMTDEDRFWALKDVSFEVPAGQVIGVIGANGAGKSTLLKILSRITEPSSGRASLDGRVASLLEVGSGFHRELTGRENIYLNGTILGMRKAEIDRKFDEIVAFAEVEKFIDTPVKHYSSGMHTRLAFAVAAHLQPEILLVDEVLAVGDVQFQKKCMGQMERVARQGRTILLVSHNMGVLRKSAQRGIWLDAGRVEYDGDINEAIARYLSSRQMANEAVVDLTDHPNRTEGMKTILRQVRCLRSTHGPSVDFSQHEEIVVELDYEAAPGVDLAGAGLTVFTSDGLLVGSFHTFMRQPAPYGIPSRGTATFKLPVRQLMPGRYTLGVAVASHPKVVEDRVIPAIGFTVHPADIYGTGYLATADEGVMSLDVDVSIATS